MRNPKDIIVFHKIDNSYAIKTGESIIVEHKRTERNIYATEWNIFAWKGYRIGCFYEKSDGSGYLYLAYEHTFESLKMFGDRLFHKARKYEMQSMKSAVTYSWLKTVSWLKNNKETPKDYGLICNKYGIRVFAGGPHENTLFSLFDSYKMIGCIDKTGLNLTGFMFIHGHPDVLTYRKDENETEEEMLERTMNIMRRK